MNRSLSRCRLLDTSCDGPSTSLPTSRVSARAISFSCLAMEVRRTSPLEGPGRCAELSPETVVMLARRPGGRSRKHAAGRWWANAHFVRFCAGAASECGAMKRHCMWYDANGKHVRRQACQPVEAHGSARAWRGAWRKLGMTSEDCRGSAWRIWN